MVQGNQEVEAGGWEGVPAKQNLSGILINAGHREILRQGSRANNAVQDGGQLLVKLPVTDSFMGNL